MIPKVNSRPSPNSETPTKEVHISPPDLTIYYTPFTPESVVSGGFSEQTPKRIYDTHPILAEIPPTQFKTGLFRSG